MGRSCMWRFTLGRWWKSAPESQSAFLNQSERYQCNDDYIELMFDHKVYIQKLNIYETYNPGAIVRIYALDQSAIKQSLKW